MVNMFTCWDRFPRVCVMVFAMERKEMIIPIEIVEIPDRLTFESPAWTMRVPIRARRT